jgi:hypothetical protein
VWTIWVGGSEVSDYYLTTLEKAETVALLWQQAGYDDVVIEETEY